MQNDWMVCIMFSWSMWAWVLDHVQYPTEISYNVEQLSFPENPIPRQEKIIYRGDLAHILKRDLDGDY